MYQSVNTATIQASPVNGAGGADATGGWGLARSGPIEDKFTIGGGLQFFKLAELLLLLAELYFSCRQGEINFGLGERYIVLTGGTVRPRKK